MGYSIGKRADNVSFFRLSSNMLSSVEQLFVEPKNHPFGKENHLPKAPLLCSMLVFHV